MNQNSLSFKTCLLILISMLWSSAGWSLPEDRFKKIDISSDRARIDNLAGTIIYEGQVELTQGTLKIMADKVIAYRNENQEVDKIIAEGQPANYQQVANPNEPLTKAYGNRIVYHALQEKLLLFKNAGLNQGENLFTGNRIEYDMKGQKVLAQGDKNAPKEDDNARIRMILQPKKEADDDENGDLGNDS